MRTDLVKTLENRKTCLESKKRFYEDFSLKYIPTFQTYLNHLLEKAQDFCNDTCNDIDDQIREINDIINDLCNI